METKEEIVKLVGDYVRRFPDDEAETQSISVFLNNHTGADLINRKNFTGHLTTSAFIINEDATALLLLKHKSLNRWLQPGGHVDDTDTSLVASALREAYEETGFAANDLQLLSNSIFDIDSHHIPENTKKQEPAHVHHDIRFLFRCSNSQSIDISLEESTDSKWIAFSALETDKDFGKVIKKIQAEVQAINS